MNGQLKMRSISLANMKKLILQCANKAISKAEQGNFGHSFLKKNVYNYLSNCLNIHYKDTRNLLFHHNHHKSISRLTERK